jgi:hypothetical protein
MMSYWLDQQGFDASKMLHPSVWLAALALGVGFFILQRKQVQQKVSELGV